MNTAREVVVKALSYKGLSDGDEFTRHYNERNGTALPLDCPWCATFVSDIMRMCGVPQSSVADYKGCTTGVEWFTAQGRFKSRESGYIPKAGDIIFYEWRPQDEGTSRDDGADHTGIVVSAGGGVVNTVEGNSGNAYAVDEWTYPLDYACIEGYGIPLYNMDNQPQDEPQEPTTDNVYQVKVTADSGLNCRTGASTGYDIVTAYLKGTVLTITAESGGWGKCDKGWVCLDYTTPISDSGFKSYMVRVTPDIGLNCRSGPGTGFDLVTAYPCGTQLTITDEADGWGATSDGWVCLEYTERI